MGVGAALATRENIELVKKCSWAVGRPAIIQKGMDWYAAHPESREEVRVNLSHMGLPAAPADVDETLRHIVIHYYEKLFALVKRYEAVWICRNRVEMGESLEVFREAARDRKSVFVAQSHFGATYLLGSVLMVNGFDIHMVGKFPPPVGPMLVENSAGMTRRYGTGAAHLINIADPSVDVPMEMFRCLMTGQIISNVFDENNEFSRPVTLLGRQLFGGSGMDLILRNFTDDRVVLVTPFLIRTGEETFRYEVDRHYFRDGNVVDSFYRSLARRVQDHPEQWYFIHELAESFVDKRPAKTANP